MMTRKEIENTVLTAVFYALPPMEVEITVDSKLDDLGATQIDKIDIAMSLEEEFDISIEDGAENDWETVRDIVDCVEKLV